jgi:hypothetical protein
MVNFGSFIRKSSKINYFSFGPASLWFTVTKIQLLPVWDFFGISRENISKIDHSSFGPVSLWLTVTEIQLLPVWGYFSDFSTRIIKSRQF